jgi:hypothetical protein
LVARQPADHPLAIRFGDEMAAADGNDLLNWRKHEMKKNLLTRPQIALVLIGHIFEELDEYDVAELFEKATGHKAEPAEFNEDIGDAWECDVPFEKLADRSLPKFLEWLEGAVKEACLSE